MRPQLFRLASSATEDGDEGLGKAYYYMASSASGQYVANSVF